MTPYTKLDTASMAHKIGKGHEEIYYNAFYKPTLQRNDDFQVRRPNATNPTTPLS